MAFMGLLPSFGSELSRRGSETYGLLMTGVGVGSIAGPLALAGLARWANERRLLVATALFSGLTLAAVGATRDVPWAFAATVGVGASQSLFMALLYKQTQEMTEEVLRGRVASFTFFFTAGVMGIFNFAFGLLGTMVAPGLIMEVSGLSFVLATFVILARVPSLRWTPPQALSGEAAGAGGA